MSLNTQPYKGARDFYPEDKRMQKHLFSTVRKVVESYGYEEYDAPLLEPLEIYSSKTSDEIVNEQTYSFEDRGGRKVAIRPEMTPSVSRMVAGRRQELGYPLRWYSIPNLWRYERPQRGRLREHWQLNVDIFGVAGLEADSEAIQVANQVLKTFGASSSMYEIRLNSRKLVDALLRDYLGLDPVQSSTLVKVIDRMHKMDHATFVAEVDALMTPTQRENGLGGKLLSVLEITKLGSLPVELSSHQSVIELQQLIEVLKEAGVNNTKFDITLMRGFDYYTDIVFEVFDTNPDNNRSMFGGGRYDGLVGLFGVDPVESVGFGMGDVTLANFLESNNLLPTLRSETDLYVIAIGAVGGKVEGVARELREMGLNTAIDTSDRKIEKQIKNAVKKDIHYALFVGDKELKDQQFTLKNLQTGEEEKHGLQRAVSIVKDYRKN